MASAPQSGNIIPTFYFRNPWRNLATNIGSPVSDGERRCHLTGVTATPLRLGKATGQSQGLMRARAHRGGCRQSRTRIATASPMFVARLSCAVHCTPSCNASDASYGNRPAAHVWVSRAGEGSTRCRSADLSTALSLAPPEELEPTVGH